MHGFIAIFLSLFVFCNICKADQPASAMSKGEDAVTVEVLDSKGKPLQGALVTPVGLRSNEEPSSYYFWKSDHRNVVETGTTDVRGNALISFPAHPMDNLSTGTVILVVQHPAECTTKVELSVDSPKPIKMIEGTKLTFSVLPVAGVTFTAIYPDIVDSARQAGYLKWIRSPDGQSLSSHIPNGNYLVRMVAVTEKNEVYFSSPLSFSLPGESAETTKFRVTKGTTQSGMLDSSVPRPIKGGWIVAHVTSSMPDTNDRTSLASHWGTFTDVASDGSFTLDNLPSGALEVVAGCDGYVSKDMSGKATGGVLRAQEFTMDNGHPITVDMEPTGDARIVVKTPDGKPLTGANVFFNPNQMTGGGTSIVGYRYKSEDVLKRVAESGGSIGSFRPPVPDFSAKTDAAGVAVIKGLPPGRQGYYVDSDSFDMPISIEMRSSPCRSGMITITGATESSDVVTMEAKGSTSLSAAIQAAKGWRN